MEGVVFGAERVFVNGSIAGVERCQQEWRSGSVGVW